MLGFCSVFLHLNFCYDLARMCLVFVRLNFCVIFGVYVFSFCSFEFLC